MAKPDLRFRRDLELAFTFTSLVTDAHHMSLAAGWARFGSPLSLSRLARRFA